MYIKKYLIIVMLFLVAASAKEGLRIVYLFDVSGSFYETTINIAANSAIEIFELIEFVKKP